MLSLLSRRRARARHLFPTQRILGCAPPIRCTVRRFSSKDNLSDVKAVDFSIDPDGARNSFVNWTRSFRGAPEFDAASVPGFLSVFLPFYVADVAVSKPVVNVRGL